MLGKRTGRARQALLFHPTAYSSPRLPPLPSHRHCPPLHFQQLMPICPCYPTMVPLSLSPLFTAPAQGSPRCLLTAPTPNMPSIKFRLPPAPHNCAIWPRTPWCLPHNLEHTTHTLNHHKILLLRTPIVIRASTRCLHSSPRLYLKATPSSIMHRCLQLPTHKCLR